MPVRICVWNLYKFTRTYVLQTEYANNLLAVINPAAAAPAYDVFAIIEVGNKKNIAPGDPARGDGVLGVLALLSRLQARTATWRVAPTVSLALGTKSETIAVFYDSATVELLGPSTADDLSQPFDASLDNTGKLFWVDGNTGALNSADTDGANVAVLPTGANHPVSLVIDEKNRKLYWSQAGDHSIWWADFDGTNAAAIVAGVDATDLAVDNINEKLYWLEGDTIRNSDLDGTGPADVIGDNVNPASSFCLDPVEDELHWIDLTLANKLQHCVLNGNKNADVPLAGLNTPTKLMEDLQREYLYWVDTAANSIQRCDLRANNFATLVAAGTPRNLCLDLQNRKMYWIETGANNIHWANLDGTGAAVIVAGQQPSSLAVDPVRGFLYWSDTAGAGSICFSRLDGTQIHPGNYEQIAVGQAPTLPCWYRGRVRKGSCSFENPIGTALNFPQANQRRPYLVRMRDKNPAGPNDEFLLAVVHSPSPDRKPTVMNAPAQNGTTNVGSIREITTLRGGVPVVIAGDYNCCSLPDLTVPGCNSNLPGHGQDDIDAFDAFTVTAAYAAQVWATPSMLSPVGPNALPTDYKGHAYDNVFSIGFGAVANAQIRDIVHEAADAFRLALPLPVPPVLSLVQFQPIQAKYHYHNYQVAPLVFETGLSDHLPAVITVTI